MSYLAPSTSNLRPTEKTGLIELNCKSQHQISPHTASIDILDNDSLLNIFYLYRPFLLGEDQDDKVRLTGGEEEWERERWWYRLAHVCQRWRNLILGSASYLGLCLACTHDTPVADMLAHSPPLPLVVDYEDGYITAEDEEGIVLALGQRDRVRRIRLWMSLPNLQKFAMAINEEYPILEYLIMGISHEDRTGLMLSETFQAPHLRHLALIGSTLSVRSRLLTTAVGLVTLHLDMAHPSTYIQPDTLLKWLSSMPQLETLVIHHGFRIPNRDVDGYLTRVILPNLHWFWFRGVSAYLEEIVCRITTPHLDKLEIDLISQPNFFFPHLLQFMNTENIRFDSAKFEFFGGHIFVDFYTRGEAKTCALCINFECWHLDWQMSSAAQTFNPLNPIFSAVEHLTLKHKVHDDSSEEHDGADRTEWHKLLKSFSHVKTLRVDDGLVEELSRCLKMDDGELLSELQELTQSGSSNSTGDAFTSFIDARQNTGHPVTLVFRSPTPTPSSSEWSF